MWVRLSVEEGLAIFVEDQFAKEILEGIIRRELADDFGRIGVYAVRSCTQIKLLKNQEVRSEGADEPKPRH
jgi:hypothetical protein